MAAARTGESQSFQGTGSFAVGFEEGGLAVVNCLTRGGTEKDGESRRRNVEKEETNKKRGETRGTNALGLVVQQGKGSGGRGRGLTDTWIHRGMERWEG